MDWNSKEGRALLWQAYPAPLGLPGLHTVGGLTCIVGASAPRGTAVYVSYDIENVVDDRLDRLMPAVGEVIVSLKGKVISANPWSLREAEGRIAMGDLLPNPDPSDVATWACLLADLWESSGRPPCAGLALCAPDNYYENWFIVPGYVKGESDYGYVDLPGLCYGDPKEWAHVEHLYPHFSGATLDPAEALIHARIMLRERL